MNVQLPADLVNFMREELAAGAYRNENDLTEHAIRRLQFEKSIVSDLMLTRGDDILRMVEEGLKELDDGQELPFEDVFDEIEANLRKRISEEQRKP